MNISVCKNPHEYIWGQHIPLIVCGGEFNMCDEVIEVALFTVNGETWLPLDMENADGSIFTEDRPIIHNLPLICFPAFVRQFKKLSDEDMSVVWDAWDTISLYS